MKEKTSGAIIIVLILLSGMIGLYVIYDSTYGKSIEGTKGYLEALHAREMAQKALMMDVDQTSIINKIQDLLRNNKRVCATLVNTRTLAIKREFIKKPYQLYNLNKMIEERDSRTGPTWKLIDAEEMPCRPMEEITKITTPKTSYNTIY